MSSVPPEIQLAVAVLALVGVIITGIVAIRNADKRAILERELTELKAKLEAGGALGLQELRNAHESRLATLEDSQKRALLEAQVRQNINESNWQRVLGEVRELKNVAKELIDAMLEVCRKGHTMEDRKVLDDTLVIMKHHRDFREKMKPLFGEIRPVDFDRLEDFHRYQGEVLLDIGRTTADRIAKQQTMAAHAERLEHEKRLLEGLASAMLRPRFAYPPAQREA